MILKHKSILALCLLVAIVFSCKEEEESPGRASLLADLWRITKYELAGVDATAEFSEGACENDDHIEFHSDGTFHDEVGTVTCHSTDEDSEGTWQLMQNETILRIDYADDVPYDWTIKQLDASTLKISIIEDDTEEELVITMVKI